MNNGLNGITGTIYLVVFNCCVMIQNSSNSIFFIYIVISYTAFTTVIADNKLLGNKRTVKYSLVSVIVSVACYFTAKSASAKKSRARWCVKENMVMQQSKAFFIFALSYLPHRTSAPSVIVIAPSSSPHHHLTIVPSTQTLIMQQGDSDLVAPSGFQTKCMYFFLFQTTLRERSMNYKQQRRLIRTVMNPLKVRLGEPDGQSLNIHSLPIVLFLFLNSCRSQVV